MTGETVNCGVLGGNDRLRISTRESLYRRKIPTKGDLINGQACSGKTQNAISSSYQNELMTCSQTPDIMTVRHACESDHIYATSGNHNSTGDASEVHRLRDLLAAHTDLIQQQRDQLLKKERQLSEALRELESLKKIHALSEKSWATPKRSQGTQTSASKKHSVRILTPKKEGSKKPVKAGSTTTSVPSKNAGDHVVGSSNECVQTSGETRNRSDDFLATSEPFYMLTTTQVDEPRTETNHHIEVPSWRISAVPSAYSMEGTEHIDDEMYQKRHLRHEIEERRRKRWDLQHIRAQRRYQRLLRRQRHQLGDAQLLATPGSSSTASLDNTTPIETFQWPPPFVKTLEIGDDLPVVTFGHPLPKLERREFSSNWQRSTASNSGSSCGQPRRKSVK